MVFLSRGKQNWSYSNKVQGRKLLTAILCRLKLKKQTRSYIKKKKSRLAIGNTHLQLILTTWPDYQM